MIKQEVRIDIIQELQKYRITIEVEVKKKQ